MTTHFLLRILTNFRALFETSLATLSKHLGCIKSLITGFQNKNWVICYWQNWKELSRSEVVAAFRTKSHWKKFRAKLNNEAQAVWVQWFQRTIAHTKTTISGRRLSREPGLVVSTKFYWLTKVPKEIKKMLLIIGGKSPLKYCYRSKHRILISLKI